MRNRIQSRYDPCGFLVPPTRRLAELGDIQTCQVCEAVGEQVKTVQLHVEVVGIRVPEQFWGGNFVSHLHHILNNKTTMMFLHQGLVVSRGCKRCLVGIGTESRLTSLGHPSFHTSGVFFGGEGGEAARAEESLANTCPPRCVLSEQLGGVRVESAEVWIARRSQHSSPASMSSVRA